MLLGVPVGRRTVKAEADAVIGLGKILEEVKGRASLPRLQIDFLSAANHNFLHALMLNRGGFSSLLTRRTFRGTNLPIEQCYFRFARHTPRTPESFYHQFSQLSVSAHTKATSQPMKVQP